MGSDALSRGRWERVFSGENGDWPNSEPRLDLDASGAHLLYTAKASNLKYYWFPFAGSPEAVPIPTTVKNPGRIVVTSTRTVILTRETFNGDTGTLFVNGSSVVAGPAPFPARLTRSDLTATRVGDDVLTLEGETVRRVPRYEGNGFRDLGAPSAPALVGLTAAAVDGARTFFVEYQGDNRSTV